VSVKSHLIGFCGDVDILIKKTDENISGFISLSYRTATEIFLWMTAHFLFVNKKQSIPIPLTNSTQIASLVYVFG